MSVTTVPIQPIAKGSVTKYWLGVGAIILAGTGLAFWSTGQIRADKATNEQYLSANASQPGVVQTASGLQIKTTKAGAGAKPTENDVAMVTIKGELRDGTVFQPEASGPFPLSGGGAIPGFIEALKQMQSGGKYRIWIPSQLAYGENPPPDPQTGKPVLPANALLIFDVEMIGFKSRAEVEAMQKQMQEAQKKGAANGGAGLPPEIQRQLDEAAAQGRTQ